MDTRVQAIHHYIRGFSSVCDQLLNLVELNNLKAVLAKYFWMLQAKNIFSTELITLNEWNTGN